MKSIGIINPLENNSFIEFKQNSVLQLEKIPIKAGILDTEEPSIRMDDSSTDHLVLVEKIAFSCNYRDKSILLRLSTGLAQKAKEEPKKLHFSFFGSEFVGRVIAKGKKVSNVEIGDRVIPDGTYQGILNKSMQKGIPSNTTSQYKELFHEDKLVKIPENMSNELAAGYTIGGQTGSAMIRRAGIKKGMDVLVTSATSNTALFIICLLKDLGVNVYAIGSSNRFEKELKSIGVKEVFIVNRASKEEKANQIISLSKNIQFDAVLDAFADTWMFYSAVLMKNNGKYITCGYYNQNPYIQDQSNDEIDLKILKSFYSNMIFKNLEFAGNCLGTKEDLIIALEKHQNFDSIIDSVFNINQSGAFLKRTYEDTNRFGKVIMRYDS